MKLEVERILWTLRNTLRSVNHIEPEYDNYGALIYKDTVEKANHRAKLEEMHIKESSESIVDLITIKQGK